MEAHARDVWEAGGAYEAYMGRWSRPVAREFLRWLDAPVAASWLDVGCGPGTLVEAIVAQAEPRAVLGIDRSEGFVAHARARGTDPRARFEVATPWRCRSRTGASTSWCRGSS